MKLPQLYAKFQGEAQHVAFPPLSGIESASGLFSPCLMVSCGLDEGVSRLMWRAMREEVPLLFGVEQEGRRFLFLAIVGKCEESFGPSLALSSATYGLWMKEGPVRLREVAP